MSRRYNALILVVVAGLALTETTSARILDSAKMVPEEVAFVLVIDSVDELIKAFKQTYYYAILFEDPAMKAFTAAARAKLSQLLQKQLKALWREIDLEQAPETFPVPHGRCVIQVFLEAAEIELKGTQGQTSSGKMATEIVPDIEMVLVADMGKDVQETARIADALLRNASLGDVKRTKKRVRGVELVILEGEQNEMDLSTFCYGFKDSYLICGSSVPHTERVIMQMGRGTPKSLAGVKGFSAIARQFADYHTFAYLQLEPLKQFALAMAKTSTQKWQLENAIHQLGLSNVQGIAMASRLAGGRFENIRTSSLIVINGPKTGIPALLCPSPTSFKASARLLGDNTIMLAVANHDIAGIYDAICQMVKDTMGLDVTFFTEGAMARTGQADGRPAVNLRQDILGQMAPPILLSWRMDKPYADPNNSKTLLSIAAHDSERLENSLARLHRTYVAAMDPDLQRTLLDHTLYLLPPMPLPSPFIPLQQGVRPALTKQLAVTFADDRMVLAETAQAEQAIRDEGKKPRTALSSDPHFTHASRHVPAKASAYFYRNEQVYTEILWDQALLLAKRASEKLKEAAQETNPGAPNWLAAFKGLGQTLDYRKLPQYQTIKKHIGPRIGYINEHPLGILMEEITLKPRR